MAEPRYSDERQGKLERYAHGKCSARSQRIGANLRWFPTIAKEAIPSDGFDNKSDAVRAAQFFKTECQAKLAETNGSM